MCPDCILWFYDYLGDQPASRCPFQLGPQILQSALLAIVLYLVDNQAVIFLMVHPGVECQTKHIDMWHHYIQEQYENKTIEPFHTTGVDNPADLFTKSLPVIKVKQFRSKIGLL